MKATQVLVFMSVVVFSAVALYGVGSFVANAFNIAYWTGDGRFMVAGCWLCSFIPAGILANTVK